MLCIELLSSGRVSEMFTNNVYLKTMRQSVEDLHKEIQDLSANLSSRNLETDYERGLEFGLQIGFQNKNTFSYFCL